MPHTIEVADATRIAVAVDAPGFLPRRVNRITAGNGSRGILLACGANTARYAGALGLFDLLQSPIVLDLSTSAHPRHALSHMVDELARPGLGTAEVIEAPM